MLRFTAGGKFLVYLGAFDGLLCLMFNARFGGTCGSSVLYICVYGLLNSVYGKEVDFSCYIQASLREDVIRPLCQAVMS